MLFRSLDGAGTSSDSSQTAKKRWQDLELGQSRMSNRAALDGNPSIGGGQTQGFPLMAQHTFRCMATWMLVMHSSDLRWCLGVQNGGYAAPRALRARY